MPIGMTTDFVCHYAIWYTQPDGPKLHSRKDKARYAFQQSSFAVIGGGILMFASSLFLLGSRLDFVFSFGVALSFTLGMATMVGMFLFLILLGIVGPEGSECTLFPCLNGTNSVDIMDEKGGRPDAITARVPDKEHLLQKTTVQLTARVIDPLDDLLEAAPITPSNGDYDSDSETGTDDSDSGDENGPPPPARLPALGNNTKAMHATASGLRSPTLSPPKSATPSLPQLISPGAE
jgi:hypothetical protein